MKTNGFTYIFILSFALMVVLPAISYSQKMTYIKGKVTNAKTNEPIPFVNVVFEGKSIGTITDYNGNYSLETQIKTNG